MLLAFASAFAATACNVPVFRYALERWPAGNFEAIVFHRGPLAGPEQKLFNDLTNSAVRSAANIVIKEVDLAASHGLDEEKLWRSESNAPLPWLTLRAPDSEETEPSVWSGRLADATPALLFKSPARDELGKRLMRGDSIVWVVIDSGDRAQDEQLSTMLSAELKQLEAKLELPPSAPDDPAPRSALPLRIAFSVLHLPAKAPGEDLFRRMLLHEESTAAGEPIVVPVFGRGRALAALSSAELSPKIVRQAATFLCGACSCEVKELNPGKDLLMALNWDVGLSAPAEKATSIIVPGQRVEIAPGTPPVRPPAAAPVAGPAPNPRRGLRLLASTGLAFSAIMILLVGIALLRALRQR